VQSHHGTIALLPALPPQWPSGAVRGLRARDGVMVDIDWDDGRLSRARLTATRSHPVPSLSAAATRFRTISPAPIKPHDRRFTAVVARC